MTLHKITILKKNSTPIFTFLLFKNNTIQSSFFHRDPKKGIILHVGLLIAGLVGTALWTWHKDLMPSLLVYYLDLE